MTSSNRRTVLSSLIALAPLEGFFPITHDVMILPALNGRGGFTGAFKVLYVVNGLVLFYGYPLDGGSCFTIQYIGGVGGGELPYPQPEGWYITTVDEEQTLTNGRDDIGPFNTAADLLTGTRKEVFALVASGGFDMPRDSDHDQLEELMAELQLVV